MMMMKVALVLLFCVLAYAESSPSVLSRKLDDVTTECVKQTEAFSTCIAESSTCFECMGNTLGKLEEKDTNDCKKIDSVLDDFSKTCKDDCKDCFDPVVEYYRCEANAAADCSDAPGKAMAGLLFLATCALFLTMF